MISPYDDTPIEWKAKTYTRAQDGRPMTQVCAEQHGTDGVSMRMTASEGFPLDMGDDIPVRHLGTFVEFVHRIWPEHS